ncbi:MAG: hypothetical protein QM800_07405 [Paludibacter sp.]
MKSPVIKLLAFLAFSGNLLAQSAADPVLMTINGKPVSEIRI